MTQSLLAHELTEILEKMMMDPANLAGKSLYGTPEKEGEKEQATKYASDDEDFFDNMPV
ncbi:hypothetical protein [Litoreibacter roseus]|uniref:Uncharacterized protein n=1 Tax=Litoreibacter roseus TaxID=2601869 RepID=A0A6N6JBK3_9RHOB|nr:hypothetical protein [Litoreibacter roseus]GFE63653.1 hypothetical protein KIN_07270 [Litoreibacter roseus]